MALRNLYVIIFFIVIISSCDSKKKNISPISSDDIQLFTSLPYTETGLNFVNKLEQNLQLNILTFKYFYNGGGVALGDINNDNLTDIYLTGNIGPNKLFLNQGNLKFQDITLSAGVHGERGWTNGATMVDINSDGWLDIYVCRSGNFDDSVRANQLFINNKDNTFTNKAKQYGLDDSGYSTHSAFFDYDLDGDLDMYLLNHNIVFSSDLPIDILKNKDNPLVSDKLYRNENGRFVNVSSEAGIVQNAIGYGLGVGVGDLNNDNYPDIYVCNDFTERDYLYINNGNGTFSESLKNSIGHTSNFSMGCDIADFNNDGLNDILVLDMAAEDNYRSKTNMSGMNPKKFWKTVEGGFHYQYMVNTLQLNRGETKFSEIGQLAGISYTDWSWAPLFCDFDNDGFKDIFITNGYRKASRNNDFVKEKDKYFQIIEKDPNVNVAEVINKLLSLMPEDKLPNYLYKNNGDLTFSKRSKQWGMDALTFSNGAAMADLDNDGDQDLVINNIDQPVSLYRNNAEKLALNYIDIKLEGPVNNKYGIGSRVEIITGSDSQISEFYPSRGYMSCMDNKIHFGLGDYNNIDALKIIWPDHKQQVIKNIESNQLITLEYSNAKAVVQKKEQEQNMFEDISNDAGINFVHKENEFDDFKKEILLPHKMSALGPCLAVGDVNNDQLDDFYVGGAKKHAGTLFVQNGDGKFAKQSIKTWLNDKAFEDLGASFLDVDNDGDLDLYVCSGGSEVTQGSELLSDRLYINDGQGEFNKSNNLLPPINTSTSVVAPCDFDKDGDIDLFIGGRMIPGKYPFPANSFLLLNNNGVYTNVTDEIAPELNNVGMVTSAVWLDVNNDKTDDLVISGEWMPIMVFQNTNATLELQQDNGLENSTGWWFSLNKADIDNDGDLDLIGGNLGLNYKYKTSVLEPFQVYCSDFDGNGSLDIYLGYFNQGELFPVRGRQCSSEQMPFISEKFKTYDAFAKATLPEVLGEAVDEALHYEAKTFASSIIENLGNGLFNLEALPVEAQFSSINGIVTEDINEDGSTDLLLAGNLYNAEVETPRADAGLGNVLINNGMGEFSHISLGESGFIADGDIKAISLINLADGSKGILIARNNAQLSLLKLSF